AERLREPELRDGEQDDGDDDAGDDPPLAPAAAHVGRGGPGGRRIGRAGHWRPRMVTAEGDEGKTASRWSSCRENGQKAGAGNEARASAAPEEVHDDGEHDAQHDAGEER